MQGRGGQGISQGRGQGMGQGGGGGRGGGTGQGLGGNCVCPNCGHREQHQRGMQCFNMKCPKCDTPLVREG